MDRVFSISERPVQESEFVAVAIGEPRPNQRHIGILHTSEGAMPELLHLAWHCRLQNNVELPHYMTLWIAPSAPPQRLRVVAAACRRIWRKNAKGGIPYAFSTPADAFDTATGAYLLGPSRFGLTCASFVLAVFDYAGLRLANYESWPHGRPGDREWQGQIIAMLEGRAEREHIEYLRSEIGAVRYRPEEVAAASVLAPPPADFQPTASLGEKILAKIWEASRQPDDTSV
jgi:hypothetical protein